MIIIRESDGSIIQAAIYPKSQGNYDKRTRNLVLAGPNSANEYQVAMNFKSHTSTIHSGYYIFSATFSIASLTAGNLPSVPWSRLSS